MTTQREPTPAADFSMEDAMPRVFIGYDPRETLAVGVQAVPDDA